MIAVRAGLLYLTSMITRESFEQAVAPFHGEMRTMAIKWCYGDEHKAEDDLQDTLFKAYLHFNECDGRNFKQWVYAILKNTISNSNRPKKHGWGWKAGSDYIETSIESDMPITSQEPLPLQHLYYKELAEVIDGFQQTLSPIDHEILNDAIDGVPQLDTAHRLHLTRQAVTMRLLKTREELRKQLREHN